MKGLIIMMILSIVYIVVMDVVNKKLSSVSFDEPAIVETQTNSSQFSVIIRGAVANPGTYTVIRGANLGYLVTLAGGVSENADSKAYDLTLPLKENNTYYIAYLASQGVDKVSINEGSAAQLDSLPGIGSVLANRIVNYRTSNGNFQSIEDLKNVSGIGATLFEEIKDLITL